MGWGLLCGQNSIPSSSSESDVIIDYKETYTTEEQLAIATQLATCVENSKLIKPCYCRYAISDFLPEAFLLYCSEVIDYTETEANTYIFTFNGFNFMSQFYSTSLLVNFIDNTVVNAIPPSPTVFARTIVTTATIPTTGWTTSGNTQYVTLSNSLTSSDSEVNVKPDYSSIIATAIEQTVEWSKISRILVTTLDTIVYCDGDIPTVEIPIQITEITTS